MWSMEDAVLHHACLLDAAYVSLYIWLCEMGLLSLCVPFFRDLSSHGKTRPPPTTRESHHQQLSFKERFARGEAFWVEKSNFTHFYVWGLVSLVCCTALGSYHATLDRGYLPAYTTLMLLALHFVRRTYECFYVHKWRKGSKIHVLGYILGSGHYLWLPMVFIRLPCRNFRCHLLQQWDEGAPQDILAYFYTALHHVPIWFFFIDPKCRSEPTNPTTTTRMSIIGAEWCIPALLLGLWAQYQQHRHHVLLARLRQDPDSKTRYGIPVGGWFHYVSCPHYTAEVLIYISFTALLELEHNTPSLPLLLPGSGRYRHWLMCAFCVLNMSLSAARNHEWYLKNIPDYDKLGRKAMVPFVF